MTENEIDSAYKNFCDHFKYTDGLWSGYYFASFIGAGPYFLTKCLLSPNDEYLCKQVLPSLNERAKDRIRALVGGNSPTLCEAIAARKWRRADSFKTYTYITLMFGILAGCLVPVLFMLLWDELKKKFKKDKA